MRKISPNKNFLFLSRNNFTVCNLLLGHSTGIKRVRMKTFSKGAKIWGILMIGVFNAARDPLPPPPACARKPHWLDKAKAHTGCQRIGGLGRRKKMIEGVKRQRLTGKSARSLLRLALLIKQTVPTPQSGCLTSNLSLAIICFAFQTEGVNICIMWHRWPITACYFLLGMYSVKTWEAKLAFRV